ncbi:MAG: hypothetical protein IPO48_07300 [Saprospiraceae bacterium]|nr:hypothetical protein [Saprospiraceae bacterium]
MSKLLQLSVLPLSSSSASIVTNPLIGLRLTVISLQEQLAYIVIDKYYLKAGVHIATRISDFVKLFLWFFIGTSHI